MTSRPSQTRIEMARAVAALLLLPGAAAFSAAPGSRRRRAPTQRAAPRRALDALLFDCDGVLADTEPDGHRVAFNAAFKEKGFADDWTVELYGELLETGGGKERMTAHWNKVGWPAGYEDAGAQQALVKELHLRKTELFNQLIADGQIPLRPGVLRLVDEALSAGVPIAVCSTSSEQAVTNLVRVLMGEDRASKIPVYAGDVVAKKKPAPDVYLLAADKLGLVPKNCVVVEDSSIGLAAAKAAGEALGSPFIMCLATHPFFPPQA